MEVTNLIQIELDKEYVNSLFFEGLNKGKHQLIQHNESCTAHVTESEFNQFIKDNNLILYKNILKQYEDGEIIGSFQTSEK